MNTGLKEKLLKFAYGHWPRPKVDTEPGYTLLMTVPPDLPVFLQLAIDVCSRQDLTHLVETLVIPDRPTRAFRPHFERARRWWPEGNLRLVDLTPIDRIIRRNPRGPSTVHWLQLVRGLSQTRTTHALLHDVDLFLTRPGFLRAHYEQCLERGQACAGVDRPWNGFPWFGLPEFEHLVACWELMIDTRWARSITPNDLRPQRAMFGPNFWPFETTLLAQARTEPGRVGRLPLPHDSVHFQFVIGTYRDFQKASGPFEDRRCSLLLIRLLIDLYDTARSDRYDLPTLEEMAHGLTDSTRRVFYRPAENISVYSEFRRKLDTLLQSGLIGPIPADGVRDRLAPFDGAHQWTSACHAPA